MHDPYDQYNYYMLITGATEDVEAFVERLRNYPCVPPEIEPYYKATDMEGHSVYKLCVDPDSDPIDEWNTSTEDITTFALMTPDVEVILHTINMNNALEEYMEIWHHGKYACDRTRLTINTEDEMREMLKQQT